MIKEIAVFINKLGKVASLNEDGIIRVYSKDRYNWSVVRELPYRLEREEDISLDMLNIIETLSSCKTLVAKEFSDLVYGVLDSMGVSIWKMDGSPSDFLEYIFEKEYEEAEELKLMEPLVSEKKKHITYPVKIGQNGYYILNIKDLQNYNVGVTSKQVLKPFLNKEKFKELVVTCSHIPNWLGGELEKLNLNFGCSKTGPNEYIIIITSTDK